MEENEALIIGLVAAAIVGAVVSVVLSSVVFRAEPLSLDMQGRAMVTLRNEETIQWIRDHEGRVSSMVINRMVE